MSFHLYSCMFLLNVTISGQEVSCLAQRVSIQLCQDTYSCHQAGIHPSAAAVITPSLAEAAFAVLNGVLDVSSDLATGFLLACNVEVWYDTQKASSSNECSPQGVPDEKMKNN